MLDLKSLNQVNDLRLLPSNVLSESNIGVRVHQTFDIEEDAYTRKKGWYEVALNRYYVAVSDPESSSYNTSSPQYQSDKDSSNIEGQNRKDGTASVEPYYIPNSNDKIIFEKSYDGYIEQVYDLEESRIIPSEDTINQRVYCLKSETAKKFAPMWYKVGEQDISPVAWDTIIKYPEFSVDLDPLPANTVIIGVNGGSLLDKYIENFNILSEVATVDTSLYFMPTVEIKDHILPELTEATTFLKSRLYKYTFKVEDSSYTCELADSKAIFTTSAASSVYNYPASATDREEWWFKGSALVIKNSMISKTIYVYQDAYFRPPIYPCYYEVKESLTTPGTYNWVVCNDTWEVDDVRKLDWMLTLEYEGYQVFQYRSVEENTVEDPDYYFNPRGTYVVTDSPDGFKWKQMMDSNTEIEFPDIDTEEVTDQFLRESMVGYRVYQTTTTYEDPDPITEEMPVKRSKGWYEVVEVYPLFPDKSIVNYEYKIAGGDRGYVTAVDWNHVEVGQGWRIDKRECWENENTCFARFWLTNIGTTAKPASRILLKKLPAAMETTLFLSESKQTSNTTWGKIEMEVTQSGNLRIHDDTLDNLPKEMYVDVWYVCEEKNFPVIASAFGIDTTIMRDFNEDLRKYAQQSPYSIRFTKKE